jgi:predicted Zn-dependent protease
MRSSPARTFTRAVRLLMLAILLSLSMTRPAMAAGDGQILRDSETELLFKDMARPLILAAGLDPDSVNIVLLNDSQINAFVSTGQTVYLHSGLIEAADNVNQVQGVVAHELGHVTGGHAIRMQDGAREATGISLATLVLGALAVAAGAPEAGMALLMAGQRAALGRFLAFTRTQEASADQAAVQYLHGAGISGKGLLQFFGKLQNQEYRLAIYEKESYDRTHPLSNERVQALTERFTSDAAFNRPPDPALEARFQRVKAKLLGYLEPQRAVIKYPESNQSVPAHYARAHAYHLGGYPDKALAETEALLAIDPDDPFFLELKGQVLLESGRPKEALAPLREAVAKSGDSPLIASMLGHALVATEDKANFAEAKAVLKRAVNRDNNNPFAWFQLGVIYDREGDPARASLASAEQFSLEGQPMMAMTKARIALAGIAPGSPDCLRAQDIAMASKAELERELRTKSRDDIDMRGAKEAIKIPDELLVCRGA